MQKRWSYLGVNYLQHTMKFIETKLKGAYTTEIEPSVDDRGWFSRVFCMREFGQINHNENFVQINHSSNTNKGTVRGIHYQIPPEAETKLIRCIRGKIFDVIIDLRENSPAFLQWIGVELSAENMKMIYVPEGFAHGFQTLEDNSELIYHHTSFYDPSAERGIRYNDKLVGIKWPLDVTNISEKDTSYPLLDSHFKGLNL